jgi:hypothetical protein
MQTRYVSLGTLAEQLDVYERMPVAIQEALKNSVNLTLKTNLISIPALLIAPVILEVLLLNPFFSVINPTAAAAYGLFSLFYSLQGYLLGANILSLMLVGLVLLLSQNMTQPVGEPVHWLAGAGAVPTALSTLASAIIAALVVALFVTTLVIWILLIVFAILAAMIVLGVLAGAR